MIPWTRLASAKVPNETGELRLMQRGAEYSIMLGKVELMNSRRTRSESELATIALKALGDRPGPSVLIGGLGMGFTLRAALAELPADARVTVVELVPEVVAWARGPMADLFEGCLDDPRVSLRVEDVGATIRAHRAAFDAILLDVDNGPAGLTQATNNRLYSDRGLRDVQRALRPNGVLAVWASARDEGFSQRLRRAGFTVDVVPVRGDGARNFIWIASRG